MTRLSSSNLDGADYSDGTLIIAFRNGGIYQYFRVPYSEYTGLLRASSHGRFFHSRIKGRYSYRKISR